MQLSLLNTLHKLEDQVWGQRELRGGPARPLLHCVILGKLLGFSELHLPLRGEIIREHSSRIVKITQAHAYKPGTEWHLNGPMGKQEG